MVPGSFSNLNGTTIIDDADAVPRRDANPHLRFRFDAGEVGLSIALFRLLTAEQIARGYRTGQLTDVIRKRAKQQKLQNPMLITAED